MLLPVDRAPRRPGASLHLCQATGSVNILGQTLQLPGVQHMRRLPCLRADREALCDLLVRMTAGEQPQHLRRTSELHDTRRKADLVTAQMERLPLAVPLLVGLPDRQRDEGVEADPFSELRTECRVRGQERLHLLEAGTGEARKPLGAIHMPT